MSWEILHLRQLGSRTPGNLCDAKLRQLGLEVLKLRGRAGHVRSGRGARAGFLQDWCRHGFCAAYLLSSAFCPARTSVESVLAAYLAEQLLPRLVAELKSLDLNLGGRKKVSCCCFTAPALPPLPRTIPRPPLQQHHAPPYHLAAASDHSTEPCTRPQHIWEDWGCTAALLMILSATPPAQKLACRSIATAASSRVARNGRLMLMHHGCMLSHAEHAVPAPRPGPLLMGTLCEKMPPLGGTRHGLVFCTGFGRRQNSICITGTMRMSWSIPTRHIKSMRSTPPPPQSGGVSLPCCSCLREWHAAKVRPYCASRFLPVPSDQSDLHNSSFATRLTLIPSHRQSHPAGEESHSPSCSSRACKKAIRKPTKNKMISKPTKNLCHHHVHHHLGTNVSGCGCSWFCVGVSSLPLRHGSSS